MGRAADDRRPGRACATRRRPRRRAPRSPTWSPRRARPSHAERTCPLGLRVDGYWFVPWLRAAAASCAGAAGLERRPATPRATDALAEFAALFGDVAAPPPPSGERGARRAAALGRARRRVLGDRAVADRRAARSRAARVIAARRRAARRPAARRAEVRDAIRPAAGSSRAS